MANRPASIDASVFTIADLKEQGNKKLPRYAQEYFNEGAMDLITLRDNEEAFNRYKIRPRVLVNVDKADTSAEIFGVKVPFPLGLSPTAYHKLAHPEGEAATSRAAASTGIPMGLSMYATTSLEEVAAQSNGNPLVMHMGLMRNRQLNVQLLQRAEKAGFKAIFVSVDCPVLGLRLNEHRNCFQLPEGLDHENLPLIGTELEARCEESDYDPTADWNTAIPWLRSQTKLPLWLKGVGTADDVILAIRHGLDGVVVSNHGGRQLDGVPASLDSLRECAAVAKGKIPIAFDGGIRRGSDIFKAIALGADFCFVGRIPIWGLAYNGQQGVELGIKILMNEFKNIMALAGCRSVKEINKGHLSLLASNGVLSKL
ncbi:(S)-2-hydroxy-acid oxidase [Phyllosticta capitalensis]